MDTEQTVRQKWRLRGDVEDRLESPGFHASASELDQSFERLELGYVLARVVDPNGPDRWTNPVPLIKRFEARTCRGRALGARRSE